MTAYPVGTPGTHPHPGRFQTVVLATDLSATSEAATTAALDLAGTLGARLLGCRRPLHPYAANLLTLDR